jgi:hypothetical protein
VVKPAAVAVDDSLEQRVTTTIDVGDEIIPDQKLTTTPSVDNTDILDQKSTTPGEDSPDQYPTPDSPDALVDDTKRVPVDAAVTDSNRSEQVLSVCVCACVCVCVRALEILVCLVQIN